MGRTFYCHIPDFPHYLVFLWNFPLTKVLTKFDRRLNKGTHNSSTRLNKSTHTSSSIRTYSN